LPFIKEFKARFPDKTVWLYTGNTYGELTGEHRTHTEHTEKLLSYVDILVDGRFVEEEKSLGLRFRGSKNQRVIDMNQTRKNGSLTIWQGCSEDRKYENKN
jgi:anaerobic ribonucleoside-triphosphate reductase activating protein